mmetsp:Transcript_32626/g.56676  ORF Transcript_32626/g.56676 Transcript_32626/m.56676 type:complete len:840 (-) Transcript_32626:3648-6167(-)
MLKDKFSSKFNSPDVPSYQAFLSNHASADNSTRRWFDEADQKRASMEKVYNDKVRLLQELDRQREQTLAAFGNPQWLTEATVLSEQRLAQERQAWVKKAAEKATERGLTELAQANEWARLKELEENYNKKRREEEIELETAKAQKQAAEWREKRQPAINKPKDENFERSWTAGVIDVETVVVSKPAKKAQLFITSSQSPRRDAKKPAVVRPSIKEARLQALQKGQDAIAQENLKKEHLRLRAELDMLKKSNAAKLEEKNLKVKADISLTTPSSKRRESYTEKVDYSEPKVAYPEPQVAYVEPKAKYVESLPVYQESRVIKSPSHDPPKTAEKNIWERRRKEAEMKGELTRFGSEPLLEDKDEVLEESADYRLLIPNRAQSAAAIREYAGVQRYSTYEDEEDSLDSSYDEHDRDEVEDIGSYGSGEPELEYEYSVGSSDLDDSPREHSLKNSSSGRALSVLLTEDDKVIEDLSIKDTQIRKIWRDIRAPSPTEFEQPKAPQKKPETKVEIVQKPTLDLPVSKAREFPHKGKEQYYIDILSTPPSSKVVTERQVSEARKGRAENAFHVVAKPSQVSPSQKLESTRARRHKSQDFEGTSKELSEDTPLTIKQETGLALKHSNSFKEREPIEVLEETKECVKPTSWEINLKAVKKSPPPRVKSQERVLAEREHVLSKSPSRGSIEAKPAEAWNIEVDARVQAKSLHDAFLEKKRDLARKLEHRELKSEKAHKEKSKEELLEIRKNMMKAPNKPEVIEVEFKKFQPHNQRVVGRLASGERPKVTKSEMKQLTARNYDNLPEVKARREKEAKKAEIKKRIANAKEFDKKRKESRLKKPTCPAKFS